MYSQFHMEQFFKVEVDKKKALRCLKVPKIHQFWPNFDIFAVQIDLYLKKTGKYSILKVDLFFKNHLFLVHNALSFILNPILGHFHKFA